MKPLKQFKSHDEMIDILIERGLEVPDRDRARAALRRFGYHRLAGYRYPFRKLHADGGQGQSYKQLRSDTHVSGVSIDLVVKFAMFDQKLRNVLAEAIEEFEVGLRAAAAYVLASRDPMAHLKIDCLDEGRCSKRVGNGVGSAAKSSHEVFTEKVRKLTSRLIREKDDFASHHKQVYGSDLPVWAIVDHLDFGNLEYLYKYMQDSDRRVVSRQFGFKHPKDFAVIIKAVRELRNLVAHAARTFNKPLKTRIEIDDRNLTVPGHLRGALEDVRQSTNRIYTHAAYLAYALLQFNSSNEWAKRFSGVIASFPSCSDAIPVDYRQSLQGSMGFSEKWKGASLWTG